MAPHSLASLLASSFSPVLVEALSQMLSILAGRQRPHVLLGQVLLGAELWRAEKANETVTSEQIRLFESRSSISGLHPTFQWNGRPRDCVD